MLRGLFFSVWPPVVVDAVDAKWLALSVYDLKLLQKPLDNILRGGYSHSNELRKSTTKFKVKCDTPFRFHYEQHTVGKMAVVTAVTVTAKQSLEPEIVSYAKTVYSTQLHYKMRELHYSKYHKWQLYKMYQGRQLQLMRIYTNTEVGTCSTYDYFFYCYCSF